LTLFSIKELKLKIKWDYIFNRIILKIILVNTKVDVYLSYTAPKSINFGKILLKSGKVGYAYNGTTKFYVYVVIRIISCWYLSNILYFLLKLITFKDDSYILWHSWCYITSFVSFNTKSLLLRR